MHVPWALGRAARVQEGNRLLEYEIEADLTHLMAAPINTEKGNIIWAALVKTRYLTNPDGHDTIVARNMDST